MKREVGIHMQGQECQRLYVKNSDVTFKKEGVATLKRKCYTYKEADCNARDSA